MKWVWKVGGRDIERSERWSGIYVDEENGSTSLKSGRKVESAANAVMHDARYMLSDTMVSSLLSLLIALIYSTPCLDGQSDSDPCNLSRTNSTGKCRIVWYSCSPSN